MADVVIDMHSGGRSAWFLPCSHMHVVDDPGQRKAMLEGMEAWCSDWHYLYIDVNGHGLLPVEAENQGKLVITTELGGGGRVPAAIHRLAWSGLNNVLRHVGVVEGEADTRASLGLPPAVIIDGRDPRNIVVSPEDGMFEAILEPGDPVARGRTRRTALVHRPPRPAGGAPALTLTGYVVVTKAIPVTEQGDSVFVRRARRSTAQPCSRGCLGPDRLLARRPFPPTRADRRREGATARARDPQRAARALGGRRDLPSTHRLAGAARRAPARLPPTRCSRTPCACVPRSSSSGRRPRRSSSLGRVQPPPSALRRHRLALAGDLPGGRSRGRAGSRGDVLLGVVVVNGHGGNRGLLSSLTLELDSPGDRLLGARLRHRA